MEGKQKVWFITGVSGGLGRSLAEAVLAKGDIVAGTLRKEEQITEFEDLKPGHATGILMDVTDRHQVKNGVNRAISLHGRIDVLVNNAGYGLFGAVEETSEEEARAQMETNFFGVIWLTQEVLPYMRAQQSGRIVQVSSVAGMRGTPGLSMYNASKHALEGFSEALSYEVAPFNIKVTIAEPGPFRTKWAGASSIRTQKVMDEYGSNPSTERINIIQGYSGNQPGDPDKASAVIIKAVDSDSPPLRLPLGKQAIQAIRDKLSMVEQDIKGWETVSGNTDF